MSGGWGLWTNGDGMGARNRLLFLDSHFIPPSPSGNAGMSSGYVLRSGLTNGQNILASPSSTKRHPLIYLLAIVRSSVNISS